MDRDEAGQMLLQLGIYVLGKPYEKLYFHLEASVNAFDSRTLDQPLHRKVILMIKHILEHEKVVLKDFQDATQFIRLNPYEGNNGG